MFINYISKYFSCAVSPDFRQRIFQGFVLVHNELLSAEHLFHSVVTWKLLNEIEFNSRICGAQLIIGQYR